MPPGGGFGAADRVSRGRSGGNKTHSATAVFPVPVTHPAVHRKFHTTLHLASRLHENPSAWHPHLVSVGPTSPSRPHLLLTPLILAAGGPVPGPERTLGIPASGAWQSHVLSWGKCYPLLGAECLHRP